MPSSIPTDRILDKLDGLLGKNNYTAARQLLLYWLDEARQTEDWRGALLITNEFMGLCRKLGEEEAALTYADDALALTEQLGIGDTVGAATTYVNAATVRKAFGRAEEALSLFERARTIYERDLDPADERLGGLYNNMALALVDTAQYAAAQDLYRLALAVMEQVPEGEAEQAVTYLNMASAAEAQYGLEEADSLIAGYLQQASDLLDRGQHRTDGGYAFVCEKCAPVFGYYGYFVYENTLKERCRKIYEGT